MTVNDDGSITFPRRGPPPRAIDGYDRDPQDPYVFIPAWDECKHRYLRSYLCPNGRVRQRPACKLFDKDVTFPICDSCDSCEK